MSLYVRFRGSDGRVRIGRVSRSGIDELPVEPLDPETLELPPPYRLLLPVEPPEVWCAGVTYERSRVARVEETQVQDVYSLVYDADRPELFLKDAGCRRTVGPGEPIGVREESTWTVPEPELALVLGRNGRIVGATAGNDVTSRDIEGANPLYLPQAKVFAGACSLGPVVLTQDEWPGDFEIRCRIVGPDGGLEGRDRVVDRLDRAVDEPAEHARRADELRHQ